MAEPSQIEVIETESIQYDLLTAPEELRERIYETLREKEGVDIDLLRRTIDGAIADKRCTTRSNIKEVNISNALTILHKYGVPFVMDIPEENVESRTLSLSFIAPANVTGTKKYVTNVPVDKRFTCNAVTSIGITFPTIEERDIDILWTWACTNLDLEKLHACIPAVIWEKLNETIDKNSSRLPTLTDTDMIALCKSLEEITGVSFMVPSKILYATMADSGHQHIWQEVSLHGFNTDKVSSMLATVRSDIDAIKFRNDNALHILQEEYRRSTLTYFANARLPAKTWIGIQERITGLMNTDDILALMKPADAKMVSDAIKDNDERAKSLLNNTCPHKKIVKHLHAVADNDSRKELLESIGEFYDSIPENSEEYIECKKCHFPLMCPHELIFQQEIAKGKLPSSIKDELAGYIYPDRVLGNYTCRICGQIIISISAFESIVTQSLEGYDLSDDPERSAFWSDVNSYTKFVNMENLVNRSSFINTIVNGTYPLVARVHAKFGNARGVSADEINAKKRVANAVYIFAAFINLAIKSSLSSDTDTVRVSLTIPPETKGGDPRAKSFRYALETIMRSQNTNIRKVPGLTEQMIVQDLLAAYKDISIGPNGGAIVQTHNSKSDDITWLYDPIFRYIVFHRVSILHGDEDYQKMLDKVLPPAVVPGAKSKKSERITRSLKTANHEAKPWKPISLDTRDHYLKNKKARDAWNELWKLYSESSYSAFIDFLKIYPIDTYSVIKKSSSAVEAIDEIGGGNNAEYNPELAAFMSNQRANMSAVEQLLKDILAPVIGRYVSPLPDKNRYYTYPKIPLGYIYDDGGNKRKFTKFENWVKAGKKWTKTDTPVDKKLHGNSPWVDTSGFSYGMPIKTDDEIMKSIQVVEKVDNMITFYDYRCPLGDSHTTENGKCTKCGYVAGKSGKEYYEKYIKEYTSDLADLVPVLQRDSNIARGSTSDIPPDENIKVDPLDFNKIIEAAKFCGFEPGAFAAIGSSEGVEYSVILKGKYTAPVVYDKWSTRIAKLHSYCLLLISKYGQLVNIGNTINPAKDVSEVLDQVRMPANIPSLSEFARDFNKNYRAVFMKKSPKEIVDFLMDSLASYVLTLRNLQDKHHSIEPAISWIINSVFYADRILARPGPINWALIGVTEEFDENVEDTSVPNDEDPDDEYGDGIDVDNDPDDGEHDGNQIKVVGKSLD